MPKSVLIVDDDLDLSEMLSMALQDAGYAARSVASGPEALEWVRRVPPDLVLLDLMLPGMNGFSVCQALRDHSATARIPIVIMTGLPGEFPRLNGVELGAVDYISKPFPMADLVSRVAGLLGRAR